LPDDRAIEMTERLLREAGIGPGMHVLDVGCGPGKVTFMLARIVGEGGRVVGIDRNEHALAKARAQASENGLANTSFVNADLMAPPPAEPGYDAIVGRRVLMYQPDRLAVVRALARVVRPGGVVAFQETDASMVPAAMTPHPLHDKAYGWLWETIAREGATRSMGLELPVVLREAGLVVGGIRAEAIVQVAGRRHHTASIVRAIVPRIVAHGVATEAEIDIDTLDARLADELERTGAAYVGDMVFCAWATKPA